ncbi:MAG: glycosyltransferase [Verrucomicrobia bacterium]|nr:glycosyltransferase [Verrucomicrobiota bacterium]
MDFSIITPSFRSGAWLKLCIASVADQQGVTHEHIVQDAGSDDGTLDWLTQDARVRVFVEEDNGMYDAVNRGLRRAQGELLAYLNCDEQYLPGALTAVKDYFASHPDIEALFADTIVVDAQGQFVACRKATLPSRAHVLACHLPIFTCATFFRRTILDRRGLFFDPRWRDVGDAAWVLQMLEQNVRMAVLRRYTSAFTRTGQNMNFLPNALREKKALRTSAPLWTRLLTPCWALRHRLAKWHEGCYRQEPFSYELYTRDDPTRRTTVAVAQPCWRLPTPRQSRRSDTNNA